MLKSKAITPLYEQLMEQLKKQIASGVYKPGDQLPSEIEMAKQNNVSVITARKAMNELAALGFVEKKQGKGTFVAVPKYWRDYTQILGFSEACRLSGLKAGSRLLDHKLVVPNAKILESLELPEGSQTVYISRLRFVNGEPMAIEINYFSLKYAFLLNETLEDSLFQVLRDKANVTITKSKKQIEICRATAKEAKLLNVSRNYPLLLVRSTAYGGADGGPVYACSQLINGERFTLYV
jgi:GntR family transcriptional regulator